MTSVDYSPRMLRLFLRARIVFRAVMDGVPRERARKLVSADVRKAARITHVQFDIAMRGYAVDPRTRAAIWGALGIVPDRELTAED